MDDIVLIKLSKELGLNSQAIKNYENYFNGKILPVIKTNYLSHLVTTIENMVNEKRRAGFFEFLTTLEKSEIDQTKLRVLIASRTLRLYSITCEPVNIKRRATTRYYNSGAIIYYNSYYEDITVRLLIAHELGHIVNSELCDHAENTEPMANLFAFIAMNDKNVFYAEGCGKFVAKSDIKIFNDIMSICPIS